MTFAAYSMDVARSCWVMGAIIGGACRKIESAMSTFIVEIEEEADGRWIADVPALPGVMVYGRTLDEARAKVQALALRVLADRLEHDETAPELVSIQFQAA